VSGYTFRVGFGLLVGNTIAPGAVVPSVAAGGVAQAATSALDWSRDRKEPRPARAWQTLFDHSQAVEQEIRLSAPMDGPQAIDWWGIPEQPSMNVSVTSGRLIRDFVPTFPLPPSTGTAPARNARCPCGSGRKFKTCCLEIQEPTRFR
jgi:hypothetical protein